MDQETSGYWNRYWRRRISRRRLLVGSGLGAAGLASAALVGCGDDNGGATPTATPGATLTPTGTPAAGTPRQGGTFVFVSDADSTLDLYSGGYLAYGTYVGTPIYTGLLKKHQGPPDNISNFEILPDLAQAVPEQPDETTYLFKLRNDIFFHDKPPVNGRAVTTDDVVVSLEKAKVGADDVSAATAKFQLDTIRVLADGTIEVKTLEPSAPFLQNFAEPPWFPIVPTEVIDDLDANPIGTGGYMVEDRDFGVRTRFIRNPNFYEPGKPYFDAYEYHTAADLSRWVSGLIAGDFSAARFLDKVDAQVAQDANSDLVVVRYPEAFEIWLYLDNTHPILKDPTVRRAMQLAIDQNKMVQDAFEGEGNVSGVLPFGTRFAIPAADLPNINKPDIAEAKRLLEAAGHGGGFTLDEVGSTFPSQARASLAIGQQLAQIGIIMNREDFDYGGQQEKIFARDYTASMGYSITSDDPDGYLAAFLPDAPTNKGWGNEDLTAKILRQRKIFDEAERRALIEEIQRDLADNLYLVYGAQPVSRDIYSGKVKNYRPAFNTSGFLHYVLYEGWMEP